MGVGDSTCASCSETERKGVKSKVSNLGLSGMRTERSKSISVEGVGEARMLRALETEKAAMQG